RPLVPPPPPGTRRKPLPAPVFVRRQEPSFRAAGRRIHCPRAARGLHAPRAPAVLARRSSAPASVTPTFGRASVVAQRTQSGPAAAAASDRQNSGPVVRKTAVCALSQSAPAQTPPACRTRRLKDTLFRTPDSPDIYQCARQKLR